MFYYTFWFNIFQSKKSIYFSETDIPGKSANINGEPRFQHVVLKTLSSI
jgi:hypothetical protein